MILQHLRTTVKGMRCQWFSNKWSCRSSWYFCTVLLYVYFCTIEDSGSEIVVDIFTVHGCHCAHNLNINFQKNEVQI